MGPIMLMVRSLLLDRFGLQVTHETREVPAYALVVAKGGPKFLHTTFPLTDSGAIGKNPGDRCQPGMPCALMHTSIGQIANWLSMFPEIHRPVIDQTGLKGGYYIQLQWTSDEMGNSNSRSGTASPPVYIGPSIFTALQQQLGLKLESTKDSVEVIVIDHIERPSEN
jgi:uncharacterized protein (TIGR03435 family)